MATPQLPSRGTIRTYRSTLYYSTSTYSSPASLPTASPEDSHCGTPLKRTGYATDISYRP